MPPVPAPSIRRLAALVLASALAAACAPAASANDPSADPAPADAVATGPILRSLRFEGAKAARRAQLEPLLATPIPPRWWQPFAAHPVFVEGTEVPDAERIARFYRTLGYFETTVEPELLRRDDGRAVELVFHVHEGEPVRLVERGIELPPEVLVEHAPEHFLDDLAIREGDVFSLDAYEAAKKELLARLAELGRPLAAVVGGADVDVRTHEARITWRVEPGPLVRFGPVRIDGLTRTDESLIRREVTIEEGDVYSLSAMRETRRNIQSLRVLGSVIVRPIPEEVQPGAVPGEIVWPMEVAVAERPPRSVRLGLGWGTDDHLRVQAGYEQRNWLGGARHLDTSLRWSSLERGGQVAVTQPHWLARGQTLRADSRLGFERTPAYDAERLRGELRVARPFGEHWSGSLGWAYSWSAVGDASSRADRLLDDPERRVFLQGPRATVRRSTVENPLDARDGSRVEVAVTPWLPGLGSQVGFASIEADAAAFEPIGPVVVAGRLRLGTLQPFGGSSADEVPLPERFYAGGGSSVRGFQFWRLGPRRADGQPIGGASVIEASAELRFPIRGALGGVTFVDAGQVDLDPWGWKPADLTYSIGAGLRFHTPLGPIRLDIAHPLNPPEDSGTTWFHFSIGQAF
jgi:outer membrane protein assembly complex protein YaeT